MKHRLLVAAVALLLAQPLLPRPLRTQTPPPAPGEIVAAAPAADWMAIAADDLLVMDLAPDARGQARRVVIQLMPAPFARGWIGNIRTLAAAHWWDATSVNRVQDNYVVQWGDATERKPLPAGLATVAETDYQAPLPTGADAVAVSDDAYGKAGFKLGWPIGIDESRQTAWPVHCYGMVGVGRNLPPDTGSGAELYAVIGHAPRHLDRNIALVGRVVAGIEHLSSLPRGTGALGFYEKPAERVAIRSIRLAGELPAAARPRFEYLSTERDSFAHYAAARTDRRDAFFLRPAGGADICNIPVPVRAAK